MMDMYWAGFFAGMSAAMAFVSLLLLALICLVLWLKGEPARAAIAQPSRED